MRNVRHDAWRRGLVLVAVLLTLAAGQCLLDQDDERGNGMALDLCLLVVVVLSIAPVLLAGPRRSGWADAYFPRVLATAPVRVLDPPPKLALRF